MTMLYNGQQMSKAEVSGYSKPCRPDYESMIQAQKTALEKHETLLKAIFAFNDHSTVYDKMAELVGELYSATISIKQNIERLIAEQEANTE